MLNSSIPKHRYSPGFTSKPGLFYSSKIMSCSAIDTDGLQFADDPFDPVEALRVIQCIIRKDRPDAPQCLNGF